MTPAKIKFKVYQGATFRQILRWESELKSYAQITQIEKSAPVVITVAANGPIPPVGWRVWVTGVKGMTAINNTEDSYYLVTGVSGNQITINSVNSSDYNAYTSGGHLVFNTPIPLSAYTSARLYIRKKQQDTSTILVLTTENGGLQIDDINKNIIITITAEQSEALQVTSAVYDLELVNGPEVVRFAEGTITFYTEVTK